MSGSTFRQKNRYDAEGFRYELEENEKVSRFLYHRGSMLAELDETNQVTGSQCIGNGYIGGYLSERKEESIRNSQSDEKASISKETGKGFSSGSGVDLISKERELCYYIRDEQGSVRYVVDQSGNVVNEYQYSAFGETQRTEGRYENRLCYNGQMYDGLTEQYYLRARYYQPQTGRFTQEDYLYEDGLNLYAYCKSNPVMYCDPKGLEKVPLCETKVQAEGDDLQGNLSTRGYSEFADGMSESERVRYIANNEAKFYEEFSERASASGLNSTQIAEAYDAMRTGDYTRMASYFDTSSPTNGAVFWSGNQVEAAQYAQSIGGTIMEQTPGGQVFNNWRGLQGMYPEWDMGATPQKPIWEALSSQYAYGTTGNVTYVHPLDYTGVVWRDTELPIIRQRMQEELVTGISEVNINGK